MDWLGREIFLPILQWLYNIFGNLGLAIIAFTILTRILILPLTIKQLRSQKKTMQLQPKVRELQLKYANNREKLAQETMKLYSEHGTTPFAGCLPLLVTMPILFGVWNAITQFQNISTGVSYPFLWIPSLTPVLDGATNTVLMSGKDPFFILPILSILSQLIVQMMAMPRNPDPQQAQMQRVMMFMPIMFGWFAFTMPAGAVVYWIAGSVIAMVQQYFTTGFGSLTRYLPFLPERTGFLTPPPVTASNEPVTIEAKPETRDFWTVLGKLKEPMVVDAGSAGDAATEQALSDTRAQIEHAKKRR